MSSNSLASLYSTDELIKAVFESATQPGVPDVTVVQRLASMSAESEEDEPRGHYIADAYRDACDRDDCRSSKQLGLEFMPATLAEAVVVSAQYNGFLPSQCLELLA